MERECWKYKCCVRQCSMDLEFDKAASRLKKEQKARVDKVNVWRTHAHPRLDHTRTHIIGNRSPLAHAFECALNSIARAHTHTYLVSRYAIHTKRDKG